MPASGRASCCRPIRRSASRRSADWKSGCKRGSAGGKTGIGRWCLEQGLKASPWTLTPAEMDFLNSSRMTRDEIFALFRVPAPIAGIVENMGLGADIWFGARVMFCEGTVQPKLDLIGQCLTRDLGRRYGEHVAIGFRRLLPAEPGTAAG